jgi:hypothetical protein
VVRWELYFPHYFAHLNENFRDLQQQQEEQQQEQEQEQELHEQEQAQQQQRQRGLFAAEEKTL